MLVLVPKRKVVSHFTQQFQCYCHLILNLVFYNVIPIGLFGILKQQILQYSCMCMLSWCMVILENNLTASYCIVPPSSEQKNN